MAELHERGHGPSLARPRLVGSTRKTGGASRRLRTHTSTTYMRLAHDGGEVIGEELLGRLPGTLKSRLPGHMRRPGDAHADESGESLRADA